MELTLDRHGSSLRIRECGRQRRATSLAKHGSQKGEISPCRVKWTGKVRRSARRGEGGLIPSPARPCYRTGPHAQIFFLNAKGLIIILNIDFSNEPLGKLVLKLLGFCDRTARLGPHRVDLFFVAGQEHRGPQGGLNLRRLSAGNRVAGPHVFPRNSKIFFCSRTQATSWVRAGPEKNAAKFRVGG